MKNTFLNLFKRFDVLAFILSIAFFSLFPRFDLRVTQLFFDDFFQTFYFKHNPITDFIYSFTSVIAGSILIIIPILILLSFILKKEALKQRRRVLVFLVSSCLIGPGLIVNSLLKDHWDRPRPYQTVNFAGDKEYEPPFQPKFNCDSCHSFVSGHASIGFYFFAFALVSRKKKWLWLPIILGGIIGGTRMLQGGHFLSDVIFSGWAVWFSTLFLYYLFFKHQKSPDYP